MTPNLFIHIYVSSAAVHFSKEDLLALLTKCRKNNAAVNITGLLLIRDGNFLQMLEGPETAVRALVAKIHNDPRHKGLITVLEENAEKRQFPDRQMGFRDLEMNESDRPPGYSDFLNASFNSPELAKNPTQVKRLMLLFKTGR